MTKQACLMMLAVAVTAGQEMWAQLSRSSRDQVLMERIQLGMTRKEVDKAMPSGLFFTGMMLTNTYRGEFFRRPKGWWTDGASISFHFRWRDGKWALTEKTINRTPSTLKVWMSKSKNWLTISLGP